MKKFILLGVAAVLAILMAFYGRDVLGLYRLQSYISDSSNAYEADGGPWPHLTDTCVNCHGVKGSSLNQRYPSLAGQPVTYLATQLQHFANGQRAYPNMGPLAMTLSAQEIDLLANYYARQQARENSSFQADPALRNKGKQLVAAGGCIACHGEHLMGHEQFPRLAGQGVDYLIAQFDAFASGKRSEPSGVMKAITSTLSPDDRRAVAHYLAALAPQAN
ncbi:c-type cytochrome [Pseudomonas sp. NY15181]|uniref:c-type cytochrome n=1 Tax=unclassified Pseudomonas TaxID=196821 RepID=UPI0002C4EA9D|nr:c-type cytochrome [Pseudomonas sp. ATCC 13867]AGI25808.1 cytochrome c, class I [Pseudomonas sp. ATCC 13867]RFQ28126.1 cytochrome c4 [Pseudomonas sp. ATCC 13867]